MTQSSNQKTYKATNARYELDPAKIFEVVAALQGYLFDERMKFENSGGEKGRFPTYMNAKKRVLVIMTPTEVRMLLSSHNIIELELSSDGQRLTMKINAHKKLEIDPTKLYHIGKYYESEEQKKRKIY